MIRPLQQAGIVSGIKVDMGTRLLPGTDGEKYTQGLTDLDKRCARYYKQGARFAKWRAVVKISENTPTVGSIKETAYTLARYAAICQMQGLCPIVEPEILMDGTHSIEICQYWTEKVIMACYKELIDQHVILEGTLLKPNMVLSGKECKVQASPAEVGRRTVEALQRTVPAAVPGITFLSGGQTEEGATVNLNAMNKPGLGKRPWNISFSYGRALQASCLKAWVGKASNVKKAQQVLMVRAKANSMAQLGKYAGEAAGGTASESLYQKGYTY
jgi:fructose-bisphosphate aldolase class I